MSSGMTTASELSGNVSKTESSTTPRSSAMSVHSLVTGTPKRIKAWLTSSVGDSPVNPLAQQESDKGKMTSEICGRQLFAVYERSNPDGSSLKTSQDCSVQENQLKRIMRSPNQNLFDTLEPFSETWPRAGMMLDGVCYRQPKWERRISEIGCGLLPTLTAYAAKWPTPYGFSKDGRSNGPSGNELGRAVNQSLKTWPTPRTRNIDYWDKAYAEKKQTLCDSLVGGQLNPTWVEWLMGWPRNWTFLAGCCIKCFDDWRSKHEEKLRQATSPEDDNAAIGVRNVWWSEDPSEASREVEMPRGERKACGCQEMVPRVATGVSDRVLRLKAIGNGQVPLVAATAWKILTESPIERR